MRFNQLAPSSSFESSLLKALQRVIRRGRFVLDEEVGLFEKEFSSYIGVPYSVGVASGTDAITLSLLALGIGTGDHVLVPAFTAFPTITGILRSGARPILVDVSSEDGLLDAAKIERKITRRTRAIVPVHLYGQSCDMSKIVRISREYKLAIVEDCAQSTGSTFGKNKTGSFGDCGAFSFYPTKNLGGFGDGGAVTTRRRDVYERLLALRNYGGRKAGGFSETGMNSRLDELQAAVLRLKLKKLDHENNQRRKIAARYRRCFPLAACLKENAYGRPVYHQFVVKTVKRKKIQRLLKALGIPTLIHYPYVISQIDSLSLKQNTTPGADMLSRTVLSLPIYPRMTPEGQRKVIKSVTDVLE